MKFYLKDYLKEINPNKKLDEDTQKNIVKDKYIYIYIVHLCENT